MPALVFPVASYPPSSGAILDSDDVNDWIYDPSNPDESLAIINGYLDYDNILSSLNVTAEYTQRGSHVFGQKASGTANLDYRWTWFGEWTMPATWAVTEYDPYQPIPGACTTVTVPWDARILVLWTVFWMNDADDSDTDKSAVFLMVDGTTAGQQVRTIGITAVSGAPEGYAKHRSWSGHFWASVTAGEHDIGLCTLADSDIRNTRMYARSIVVVPFKRVAGGEAGV